MFLFYYRVFAGMVGTTSRGELKVVVVGLQIWNTEAVFSKGRICLGMGIQRIPE